jgi:hypothetical protein
MMYRHWTLCVLFSLVLVILSAIFAGLGHNLATAFCAIVASASVIYYGFVFRAADKALTAKRAELERGTAECEAKRRTIQDAHRAVIRSEEALQVLIREALTIHEELEARKRARDRKHADN